MPARVAYACLFLALSPAVAAHHSYVSKYDSKKVIRLSGAISGVSYKNPHIFFTLSTANGSWTIETEGIAVARGAGLTEAVLKDGAMATVTGWPARNGGGSLGLKSITIGGRTMSLRGTAR